MHVVLSININGINANLKIILLLCVLKFVMALIKCHCQLIKRLIN